MNTKGHQESIEFLNSGQLVFQNAVPKPSAAHNKASIHQLRNYKRNYSAFRIGLADHLKFFQGHFVVM